MSFIVKINDNGKDLYFQSAETDVVHTEGSRVKWQTTGIFTDDLSKAKKFDEKSNAEWVASGYDAEVVAI